MLVYCFGLVSSCLLTWICTRARIAEKSESSGKSDKYCIISALLSSAPLIYISAVRYNVGRDYRAYAREFRQIAAGAKPDIEWLYYLLNKVTAYFCRDYAAIFVVTAILCIFLVFIQIFRDSPSPVLSVFFFVTAGYYFISMNAVRQMIGCAIVLCSLHAVSERKFLRFLLMVVIAGGFHKSCFLFIIVYFLNEFRLKKEFFLAGTVIVYLFSGLIGSIINQLVTQTAYSDYLGSVYDNGKQGTVTIIISLLILVFACVFFNEDNKKYYLYFVLQSLALWMSILTGKVVLINRLGVMFGLPVIILLPMTLETIKDKWLRFAGTAGVAALYSLYMIITVGVGNSNTVLPYTTFFFRITGY